MLGGCCRAVGWPVDAVALWAASWTLSRCGCSVDAVALDLARGRCRAGSGPWTLSRCRAVKTGYSTTASNTGRAVAQLRHARTQVRGPSHSTVCTVRSNVQYVALLRLTQHTTHTTHLHTRMWSPVNSASNPTSSPFLAIIPNRSGVAICPRPGRVKPYFMIFTPDRIEFVV